MRSIPLLGDLHQEPGDDHQWNSEPIPVLLFDDTPLEFAVTVEGYDSEYPSEVVDAVGSFLTLNSADRLAASDLVYENYADIVEKATRRGVLALFGLDKVKITRPRQVWKHVTPNQVVVERGDNDIYVTVSCSCAWDQEHGLQLVYRRGIELVRVSAIDGHLTDADAYGVPDE